MTLYLPRNLAALARITATENPRYAVTAVRVLDPGDGTYRLEATDGRRLAVVRGPSRPDPASPDLDAHDGGLAEVLVARDDWLRGFKLGKAARGESVIGFAAGAGCFVFASPGETVRGTTREGRYPPVDQVLPPTPPLVQFRVNPELLASLLDLVADLGMETATLLYYGQGKPVGVAACHPETGQFLDGVIMPLT